MSLRYPCPLYDTIDFFTPQKGGCRQKSEKKSRSLNVTWLVVAIYLCHLIRCPVKYLIGRLAPGANTVLQSGIINIRLC